MVVVAVVVAALGAGMIDCGIFMRAYRVVTYVLLITTIFSYVIVSYTIIFSWESGIAEPSNWTPTTPLLRKIANFAAVSSGKRIYVIGGGLTPLTPEGDPPPIKDVYYAQILPDGRLSEWKLTSLLPDPLALHTAVITNSTIYVIGGYNAKNKNSLSTDTFYATIQSDGSLSAWNRSATKLPIGISLLSAVVKGDYIYITGGYDTISIASKKFVFRTRIIPGGDISGWERLLDMHQSNYRHTSEIYGDKLYVIGGRERRGEITKPLNSIYIGQIDLEDKINGWTPTEFLPQNLYFHGSVLSKSEGKIYTFGGYDGNLATDKVYNTLIKTDGSLEPWVEVPQLKLPKPLFRHSVVLAENGSIYLLGGKYNDRHVNEVYFIPPLSLTKSADPPGPVHEGDVITYTIAYANTGLTTQTITITDQIPFNVTLEPGSIDPPEGRLEGSNLIWNFADVPPGTSDHVSFRVRVPLLPSLNQISTSSEPPPPPPSGSPAYVLPAAVSCDTTRFWANGVTRQPPTPNPHTIQVQIPPAAASIAQLEMWLLVRGPVVISPTIGGQFARLEQTSTNDLGASVWSAVITPEMRVNNQITVVTHNPCELNALFLFDQDDPPFEKRALDDFANTSKTFSYTIDLPSVLTQTMDVILPFMDVNYWNDQLQPNTDLTTITAQFDGQSQTILANQPNLGNGLLLTQFPFNIGPLPKQVDVVTKTLTVSVDTQEFIYTLGPRVCRPVLIENTAWLCSDKAGCISSTATNVPETFAHPATLYLPIILKSALH